MWAFIIFHNDDRRLWKRIVSVEFVAIIKKMIASKIIANVVLTSTFVRDQIVKLRLYPSRDRLLKENFFY